MVSTETLLGPPVTPDALRTSTFTQVKRGVDEQEVSAYLARVADHLEALLEQVSELEGGLREAHRRTSLASEAAEAPAADHRGLSEQVAALLTALDADVDRIRHAATSDAEALRAAAREEADAIRHQAWREMEQIHADADRTAQMEDDETSRALDALLATRTSAVEDLRAIREQALRARDQLESVVAPGHQAESEPGSASGATEEHVAFALVGSVEDDVPVAR